MSAMDIDQALGPFAGPCVFCGRQDKRHRVFDAIRECHRAGDSLDVISFSWDMDPTAVRWVLAQPRFPRRREAGAR